MHGIATTPLRKFNVSPKPEFRHFKAKCDVRGYYIALLKFVTNILSPIF